MVLAADTEPAGDPVRRTRQGALRIAQGHLVIGQHERPGIHRLIDVDDRIHVFVVDPGQCRCRPRLVDGRGRNGEDRLTGILDQAFGEDRIVALDRAGIVDAGHIVRCQHADNTGRCLDRVQVDTRDPGVRPGAHGNVGMKHSGRFGNVVDIDGRTRRMFGRAVMHQDIVHAASDLFGCVRHVSHVPPPAVPERAWTLTRPTSRRKT